ncbi:MAG: iron-containing alcohol dehydrogenase, partial [Deltaproteobacteria bacterium]
MKTVFHFPTRILFGEGALDDMPPHLSALGLKRPLVVTDRGLMSTDLPERIVGLLRSSKFEPATFYKID